MINQTASIQPSGELISDRARKAIGRASFAAALLTACVLVIAIVFPAPKSDDIPLSEFVVGRWVGSFAHTENGVVATKLYQVEFVPPGRVVIHHISEDWRSIHTFVFKYHFTGPTEVDLEARMGDLWHVSRSGSDLTIASQYGNFLVQDGLYYAQPTIYWPGIALILAAVTIGLLCVDWPWARHASGLFRTPGTKPISRLRAMVTAAAPPAFILIGLVITLAQWQNPWLLLIRKPWDGALAFQLGVALFLLGHKFLMLNRTDRVGQLPGRSTLAIWGSCFIIGLAVGCLAMGIGELVDFLSVGYYPRG